MGRLEVRSGITDAPVPARSLSALKLIEGAVQTHEVDIVRVQQLHQAVHPLGSLDDVLDHEVVASSGEGWQGRMESREEPGPQVTPEEVPFFDSLRRENLGVKQVIDGVVPERFIQHMLERRGKRGLA
jgi:hypothetical protein